MQFFYPEFVDVNELPEGDLGPDWNRELGVGGLDPRAHASAAVGQRNVELAARAIGEKARELLESLPPEHRGFNLPKISPEHWWSV